MGQLGSSLLVPGLIGGRKGLIDGIRDLIFMEGDHSSVPFPNLLHDGHRATLLR